VAVKRDIPERQNPRDREGSRVLGVRGVGREMSGGVGPSFQIGVGFRRNKFRGRSRLDPRQDTKAIPMPKNYFTLVTMTWRLAVEWMEPLVPSRPHFKTDMDVTLGTLDTSARSLLLPGFERSPDATAHFGSQNEVAPR
jgi:hypothetical protein